MSNITSDQGGALSIKVKKLNLYQQNVLLLGIVTCWLRKSLILPSKLSEFRVPCSNAVCFSLASLPEGALHAAGPQPPLPDKRPAFSSQESRLP